MKSFIGMKRVLYSDSKTFVTDFGIKTRQKMFKHLQTVLRPPLEKQKKIVVEHFPSLQEGEAYIFASNHWFLEDFMITLATVDRDVFTLFGSTDQIEHSQASTFPIWLSGMVYVDRTNKEKRHDGIAKMSRLLKSGASVLVFPEGMYNNSENLLCLKMFSSPYTLNQETGAKVVPVAVYTLPELDTFYINYGEPMDFTGMERKEAMELLRDTIATMHYEHIEKYGGLLKRSELDGRDIHMDFMLQRRQEYLKMHWTRDVWDEELMEYKDKNITEATDVREELSKVKVTARNAHILAPILVRHQEDIIYDFKQFMKDTWDKTLL